MRARTTSMPWSSGNGSPGWRRTARRTCPRSVCFFTLYDPGQRFPPVSGAADHRQDHPAVVWRLGGGMGSLPALLPGGAAAGIPLRLCAAPVPETATADGGAYLFTAGTPDR